MTFAAVGAANDFSASTFTLTPAGVGHLLAITVRNVTNNTVTVTGVSSSNATWTQMGSNFSGTTNADTQSVWAGTATSTSAATVTVSWSGTTPTTRVNFQEFSSTVGSWAFAAQGNLDVAGTATWPSLTANAGDLYFGSAFDTVGAVAGSTTGYTYVVDSHGNGMAYNPNCAGGATAPVWGDAHMAFGVVVLIRESGAAVPGTVQPYTTIPVPRRRPARGVIAHLYGPAYVAVAATGQNRTGPRRYPARVLWHGTAVPFLPQSGPPGSIPAMTVNRTELMSRVTGRVIRR